MLQPQAVIFENDNVLTCWQSETLYDRVIGIDRRRALHGMNKAVDAGALFRVLQDCGLPPEGLLFTYDRAVEITAAARRAWRTHHFESWQGWARRQAAEGLLTLKEANL